MALYRDIYADRSNSLPQPFLQSLLLGELIRPSSRLWISSPWINDIDVIDNTARQFGTLVPSWPASWIRLSAVLGALLDGGCSVVVVANHDPRNSDFLGRIEALSEIHADRAKVIRTADVHEKGILSDHFTLDGSMNFTYSGVHINQEYLSYRCDPQVVHERRLILERRWGPHL